MKPRAADVYTKVMLPIGTNLDEILVEPENPKEVDKVRLEELEATQVIQLVRLELQIAKVLNIPPNHVWSYNLPQLLNITTPELVLDHRRRKHMKNCLHHGQLV